MNLTLLIPRVVHPAIEERYGAWQSELILRREHPGAAVVHYDPVWSGEQILEAVETDWVLALTDPTALPPSAMGEPLLKILADESLDAAVPATNEDGHPEQRRSPPEPYLTLRQLELIAARMRTESVPPRVIEWDGSNPGAFAASAEMLDLDVPLSRILKGRRVAILPSVYLHRFTAHRGQTRSDLLDRVPPVAKSVLEFGCGEGVLGAAIKESRQARVVGIELDPAAAALAARRLDVVLSGDATDVIYKLKEKFDTIIGGDILEHIDEPWTFLADLRRIAEPGATLILSLPNVANWAVVDDLLHGRFDYVYLGLLCAGHLRFFTRRSIGEMMSISGWTLVSIDSQEKILPSRWRTLAGKLDACGIEFSSEDLESPGYYVVARNVERT
ncbi:MAG TPA: class I SAM-dependent methyltransferase [Thermoanaerobaculia bacterium]|nr:class I SAM-dependent methyltransferase [Thermoanaerobaculia bacterium]